MLIPAAGIVMKHGTGLGMVVAQTLQSRKMVRLAPRGRGLGPQGTGCKTQTQMSESNWDLLVACQRFASWITVFACWLHVEMLYRTNQKVDLPTKVLSAATTPECSKLAVIASPQGSSRYGWSDGEPVVEDGNEAPDSDEAERTGGRSRKECDAEFGDPTGVWYCKGLTPWTKASK